MTRKTIVELAAEIDVLFADNNSKAVTLSNGIFVVSAVPVRTA